jgi:hypothetical protein
LVIKEVLTVNIKISIIAILLLSCTCVVANITKNYDFDHKVHYSQEDLGNGQYNISIQSNDKTPFNQQTAFLFRFAYKVCQRYGFTMVPLKGVEGFDDARISPNFIQPSLTIKLSCPSD